MSLALTMDCALEYYTMTPTFIERHEPVIPARVEMIEQAMLPGGGPGGMTGGLTLVRMTVHCDSLGSAVKDSRRAGGNEGTYVDHVRREETAYLVEFEQFERTLSAEDRARLNGAAAPDLEDHYAHSSKRVFVGLDRDAADSYAAAEWSSPILDRPQDEWREAFPVLSEEDADRLEDMVLARVERDGEEKRAADLLGLIAVFLDAENLRMQAAALAFAAGLPSVNGFHSMADWAAAHGITRAAVSKVAKVWQRRLNLPPGPHLKDEDSCKKYSEAQSHSHWRRQPLEK